jgi:hypothetical protein
MYSSLFPCVFHPKLRNASTLWPSVRAAARATTRARRSAEKDLQKLELEPAVRILCFLNERLGVLDDPRSIGEALKAPDWAAFGNIALATIGSSLTSTMAR